MAVLKVNEGLSAKQLDDLHVLQEWRLGFKTTEVRSLCMMALQDVRNGRGYETVQRKLAYAIRMSPEPLLQRFLDSHMSMMHAVLFDFPEKPGTAGVMKMYLLETEERLEDIQPFLSSNSTSSTQEDLRSLCAAGLFLADLWGDLKAQTDGLPWSNKRAGWVKAMRRTAADYLDYFDLPVRVRVATTVLLPDQTNPKRFLSDLERTAEEFWQQEGRLWSPLAR